MAIDLKSPKQAELPIQFVIVGGGLAGLACAIALRRVGHKVLVLEKNSNLDSATGGVRMPPNLSKILYHWGLKDELHKIAIKSMAIDLILFETGELLGKHIWDDELFREARGDFIFAHHADVRQFLYDTAISAGAKVRLGAVVSSIDPEARTVSLDSGEVLNADVIVGADGQWGVSRGCMDVETPDASGLVMYSTTVPKQSLMDDPELADLWDESLTSMYSWFGNGHGVLAFPTGGQAELALYVYAPANGEEPSWEDEPSSDALQSALQQCEPRLRKLARLAAPSHCVPVRNYSELEDWVHESGHMVLIGQAAHPIPPGSIQDCAMTIEDGAVLAKLFSHLRSEDQISSFLYAFEELRQPRCTAVITKEVGIIHYMTMPPCEMQEFRDQSMRAKRDAGLNALQSTDDMAETQEWAEIKEVFGYDAEDEADNWWVEWGRLRLRAKGEDVTNFLDVKMTVSS
ncbi:hypothetical protein HGRIS_001008 [Hohenbuehelia grisea]|uniref:FAD-binding domain-containing protein n=1 Tax=Hohenbuehelia grisea TaxID=104357 RepID=A0ABR3IQC8_9AGAR